MPNYSKKIVLFLYIIAYILISKLIFINVYDSTGYIIDELFHVPQGQKYCQLNFTAWDPKITTLPGLYIVSTALMAPFGLCTIYWLRLTNLIASVVNIVLFTALANIEQNGYKSLSWSSLLTGINLSVLPPLYFFSHVYYTDTLAVTLVVLTTVLFKRGRHLCAAFFGACSVLMRQTNIIWVAFLLGQYCVNTFVNVTSKKANSTKKTNYDYRDVRQSLRNIRRNGLNLKRLTVDNLIVITEYSSVLFSFVIFVYMNGGIVVGDKSAHEATVHLPQLFYFTLFCSVFALPHFCGEIVSFMRYTLHKKKLILCSFLLCALIVHFNTLVHPYLLADNRHYTFYIWNRIYNKYWFAKYALITAYIFGTYALLKKVNPFKNFVFWLLFVPSLLLVLVPQKLVDVRYFLIPFVVIRARFKKSSVMILICEFLLYLFINYQVFYVFFTKDIYWKDFSDVQRLIW